MPTMREKAREVQIMHNKTNSFGIQREMQGEVGFIAHQRDAARSAGERKGKGEDARTARWLSPPPAAGQGSRGAAPCSHRSERERGVGADCARVTAGSTGGRFCSPDPRAGPSDSLQRPRGKT